MKIWSAQYSSVGLGCAASVVTAGASLAGDADAGTAPSPLRANAMPTATPLAVNLDRRPTPTLLRDENTTQHIRPLDDYRQVQPKTEDEPRSSRIPSRGRPR